MKVIAHIDRVISGKLIISVDEPFIFERIRELSERLKAKNNGFCKLEITAPYKSRTTGKNSQNNLIWKYISEIAKVTGNEIEDVEQAAKERAIKRGYPYRINKLSGAVVPYSMRDIDTQQAGFLIDELEAIAAEYGVELDSQFSTNSETVSPHSSHS